MPEDEFVDTNIPLRILLNDIPSQHDAAEAYLRSASASGRRLIMTPATVSEVMFVLSGRHYRYEHNDLVGALERLLALPLTFIDRPTVERAKELFRTVHRDWDDCLLAAYALRNADGRIVSFDAKLGRIPDVTRLEP